MSLPRFDRPTRGAVRLNILQIDPQPLEVELVNVQHAWKAMSQGHDWAQIVIANGDHRHPILKSCRAITRVIDSFPSRVVYATLKSLGPGGWIHEHRDFKGSVPLGLVRLHVPIATHPDVEFYVNGIRMYLGPGEVWNVDTSYPHRVANNSTVSRVHLVVDVELNDEMRALLPKRDIRDRLHATHFWLVCCLRGAVRLVTPRVLFRRIRELIQLRILRKSAI